RRLVHGSPVHYEPGLAANLHDLSLRLSEAGDNAGARAAIVEAIVMRRRWARYGARYAEGLAKSLALLTSIEMAAPGSVKIANAMRKGRPQPARRRRPDEGWTIRECLHISRGDVSEVSCGQAGQGTGCAEILCWVIGRQTCRSAGASSSDGF